MIVQAVTGYSREGAQLGCIADFTFLTDMCFAETVRVMLTEYVIEAGISLNSSYDETQASSSGYWLEESYKVEMPGLIFEITSMRC